MIGCVAEGRYAGAEVHRLPDKNVLYIRTEDGSRIALSKKNVISIDDVTDQYPEYGRKVMMVLWNDFETSIIRLGKVPAAPQKEPDAPVPVRQEAPVKKKRPAVVLWVCLLVVVLLAAALVALKFLPGREAVPAETTIPATEATETAPPETTVETEPPTPYADEDFLADIERSVKKRLELANSNENTKSSYRELVNAELAIVGKYREEIFRDEALRTLAMQYLDGLQLQSDALELSYSEHQIKWQEGLVCRYEALIGLHGEFGAFADDAEFVSSYVLDLPAQQKRLAALIAIEADLLAQLDGVVLQYASYEHGYAMYTNNTEYDFDINFYFWFYDQSGVRFDEHRTWFSNLKSGETSKLTFYCPNRCYSFEFFWEIIPHS